MHDQISLKCDVCQCRGGDSVFNNRFSLCIRIQCLGKKGDDLFSCCTSFPTLWAANIKISNTAAWLQTSIYLFQQYLSNHRSLDYAIANITFQLQALFRVFKKKSRGSDTVFIMDSVFAFNVWGNKGDDLFSCCTSFLEPFKKSHYLPQKCLDLGESFGMT